MKKARVKRAKQSTTSKPAGREETEVSEGSYESGRSEELEQNEYSYTATRALTSKTTKRRVDKIAT